MTALAGALLMVGTLLLAQQPARDVAAQVAARGTARVTGVVVTADGTPQPVRRAIVTLSGAGVARSTITDESGTFTFGDLPAGSFTVSAARRAFLTSAFGSRYPGEPGTPIHLAEGAHATGIRIVQPKGAVLTGTITDINGQPVPSLPVTAFRLAPLNIAAGSATTDDRGEYRIYGLMPGSYAIAAVPRPAGTGDMAVRTEREVDALLSALARRGSTAATATRPGAGESLALEAPPERAASFAPFFYPGTPVAADAGRIVVAAGETRAGLDFTLGLATTASIAGVVTDADGRPAANVQMTMLSTGPPLPMVLGIGATGTMRTGADGSFTFGSVTPGSYRITARSGPASSSSPLDPSTPPRAAVTLEWAVSEVTVNGEDIGGIAMTLQPALRLAGKVVFEGTSKIPATLEQLAVVLQSFPQSARAGGSSPVPVKANGTFDAPNLMPGKYAVDVILPKTVSDTWWVRSAIVRGHDVLDVPLELSSGTGPSELVVTLSDRRASLSGAVRSDGGAQLTDAVVIAFSADRAHWRPDSRRVRAVRPGTDGRYEITDLPAGDYLLIAVRQTVPDAWHEAAFLESFVARSIRVTINEGERKTADVNVR